MNKLRLSASRINTYLHCPKAYEWNYIHELEFKQKSKALQIGDFLHTLLEKDALNELTSDFVFDLRQLIQEEYPENSEEDSREVAEMALSLYNGHKKKFEDDETFKIDSVEVILEADMGDFDLICRNDTFLKSQDGRMWRGEYKTTARIDSAYLSGLKNGLQAGIAYLLSEKLLPNKLTGTIYNLMVKTKVPQYERTMVLAEKSLLDRTVKCVNGVADGILNNRFYPSIQCHYYNRECEYLPLCRNDTPQTRSTFYRQRVEFYNKAKR